MAFTSGPFGATVTSSLTINPPQPGGTYYSQVVVSNVTPFLATVVIQSAQSFLLPYTSDVFDVTTAGTSVSVAMAQAPGGPSVSTAGASSFVTAEWYLPTDTFPGTAYPISLTSQAVAAAISGAVTSSYTETNLGTTTGTSAVIAVAAGTQALRILVPLGTTRPRVVGNTTNEPYPVLEQWGRAAGGTIESLFVCAVDSTADALVTVTFGGSVTFTVIGINAPQQVSTYPANVGPASQGAPAFTAQIGGQNSTGQLVPVAVGPPGAGSLGSPMQIAGQDGSGNLQIPTVTAPGAANPSEAQVVQAGSDGTNTHLLSTDTSGRALLGRPAGLLLASWNSSLAAAAATTIIAAVGGKTITPYLIAAGMGPGAATLGPYTGTIQGITSGTIVSIGHQRAMTAVGTGEVPFGTFGWVPGGIPGLSVGEGLEILAAAGNAAAMESSGIVLYTQA